MAGPIRNWLGAYGNKNLAEMVLPKYELAFNVYGNKLICSPSKPATTEDASTPEPEVGSFSVVLLVLQKDQQMKGKGRKPRKVVGVDPKTYGPVAVSMDATWAVFLQESFRAGIPKLQDVRQLRIDTFHWYFTKRDISLPLQTESNFSHAAMRLQSRKVNEEKLIYLEMQPPRQIQQREEEHLPWEPTSTTLSVAESGRASRQSPLFLDEDQSRVGRSEYRIREGFVCFEMSVELN
ncbi:hypothetical protein BDP27DRAFT_1483247 [Rhodocollybia butyracea]|uniref:Uncharacterized protein n=1 Tax=Rhodocollybia butyracea TaxID=206335 RepID=A0A9P5PEJ4_9AGAR|nr:hypothetical protein BDP27DRAFT_1483247 [Rhodocollybia butyracea]